MGKVNEPVYVQNDASNELAKQWYDANIEPKCPKCGAAVEKVDTSDSSTIVAHYQCEDECSINRFAISNCIGVMSPDDSWMEDSVLYIQTPGYETLRLNNQNFSGTMRFYFETVPKNMTLETVIATDRTNGYPIQRLLEKKQEQCQVIK